MPTVTRLSPEARTGLRVGAILLLALGAVLLVTGFVGFVTHNPAHGFDQGLPTGAFLMFAAGGALLALGAPLAKLAFLKPVSEILATEASGAVRTVAGAAGQGFATGQGSATGQGAAGPLVKLRCRSCQALASEDARFCPACGQPM